MTPIASRFLLAMALLGAQVVLATADDAPPLIAPDARLPAFVPNSGRANFATALDANRASATAARHAAEALSAKFADLTTNSIAKEEPSTAAAAAPMPAADAATAQETFTPVPSPTDPPHVVTTNTSRSFMLTSKRAAAAKHDPRVSKPRAVTNETRHHAAPAGAATARTDSLGNAQTATGKDLSSLGTKVGFLGLLTNPALWPSPFASKP